MDNRRFGVEIEHGNSKGNAWVADAVRKKFPRWNNTGSDGSGVEVRSPILRGQSGRDELGEVMEYLKEIGGFITQADGMHVHHDAGDFVPKGIPIERSYFPGRYTAAGRFIEGRYEYPKSKRYQEAADNVNNVLLTYATNQALIDQLCDTFRKGRPKVNAQTVRRAKREKYIPTGPRYNIHYAEEHGTFEFRQFEGCLDPAKAIAWIDFGQHFLNYCKNLGRPATCATSAKALLRRIELPGPQQKLLLDRPRATQLAPRNW